MNSELYPNWKNSFTYCFQKIRARCGRLNVRRISSR